MLKKTPKLTAFLCFSFPAASVSCSCFTPAVARAEPVAGGTAQGALTEPQPSNQKPQRSIRHRWTLERRGVRRFMEGSQILERFNNLSLSSTFSLLLIRDINVLFSKWLTQTCAAEIVLEEELKAVFFTVFKKRLVMSKLANANFRILKKNKL